MLPENLDFFYLDKQAQNLHLFKEIRGEYSGRTNTGKLGKGKV